MKSIFIYKNDQEYGPYSVDEVKTYLAAGNFLENDYARTEISTEWRSLKSLLDLNETALGDHAVTPQSGSGMVPLPEPLLPRKPTNSRRATRALIVGLLVLSSCCAGILLVVFRIKDGMDGAQSFSVPVASTGASESASIDPFITGQAKNEILAKVTYRAVGTVIQRLDDGYLVHVGLVTGALAKQPKFEVIQLLEQGGASIIDPRNRNPANYFVPCQNPTLVDDDGFDQIVYYTDNSYSYTTAASVQRTVHVLALSEDDAIAALKDQIAARQTELVESAKQAAQEKADQEVRQEVEFVDDLKRASASVSSAKLDEAQKLFSEAEGVKPGDGRLNSVRTQLQIAQLGIASKSFQEALRSNNIAAALADLLISA